MAKSESRFDFFVSKSFQYRAGIEVYFQKLLDHILNFTLKVI